jgi:FeS assembly protein IscX
VRTLTGESSELYWDATFAIVMALMEYRPHCNPEDVGLIELADLVKSLPGFDDDPDLATDRILLDIQTTWYEEVTNL